MRVPRPHLGRRAAATTALVAVVAVAVAVILINQSSGSANAGTGVGSTATGAASVQRRNLVQTDTESGTLSYAESYTVYNRLSGTITWLPDVGQVITPGHRLFNVDGHPVVLLDGTHPAYRSLESTDNDGDDILQLNANLVDLGYNPDGIVVDDEWQAATTAGVKELQKALGVEENGTLSLGDVVFLPGAQLVSALDSTVGSTGGGGGSDTSYDGLAVNPEFVDFTPADTTTTGVTTSPTTTTTTTGATTTPTTPTSITPAATQRALTRQIAQLKAEIARLRASSNPREIGQLKAQITKLEAKVASASPDGGNSNPDSGGSDPSGSAGTATAILQTTSTNLVVTVDLNASLQSEARVGEKVTVEMPDGSTVGAHVTSVSSVASSSSGDDGSGDSGDGDSGSSPTIPVTVTLDHEPSGAGLDQASVSVNFAQAKAYHVLSVPVTALLATGGNSFAVQEASAPHKLIPVTTGIFAAGYVEISGSGIYPGLKVTDSQG
jgi:hypothetical protein